jgi:hypothetical protein
VKTVFLLIAASTLAACANTGVMMRDNGQFFIAKADAHISSGPPANIKKEALAEATAYCAKDNKVFESVKLEENDAGPGKPAAIALTFKCAVKR